MGEAGVCDFAFGNPQEMPLEGHVVEFERHWLASACCRAAAGMRGRVAFEPSVQRRDVNVLLPDTQRPVRPTRLDSHTELSGEPGALQSVAGNAVYE